MFVEICMKIHSLVYALSRQNKQAKSMRKQRILFVQVIKFL